MLPLIIFVEGGYSYMLLFFLFFWGKSVSLKINLVKEDLYKFYYYDFFPNLCKNESLPFKSLKHVTVRNEIGNVTRRVVSPRSKRYNLGQHYF